MRRLQDERRPAVTRIIHVWFLIFPGSEILDLAGPWSALGYANEVLGREAYSFRLASPCPGIVRTRHGLAIAGAASLEAVSKAPHGHTLVVAGGTPAETLPAAEARTADWLRKKASGFERVVSICTGAFILGAAGLLDGGPATTHWLHRERLRETFPLARIADDEIFVRNENVWTSAGIMSGVDLMLAIIEEDFGQAVSMAVARGLVLSQRRSGRQGQVSKVLKSQEIEPSPASEVRVLIGERLREALPVQRLAELMNMSERTFSRWCSRTFDETPAALVRRVRLEEARRLLEQTDLPIKVVADRSGLGDPATLWRQFAQRFGTTPAEHRARYR